MNEKQQAFDAWETAVDELVRAGMLVSRAIARQTAAYEKVRETRAAFDLFLFAELDPAAQAAVVEVAGKPV